MNTKMTMNNPALYAEKPLVVWRADFRDGVQEGVLREVVKEYNKNKPLRCYHDPSRLGFYVVLPATAHPRFDWADDFESGFALIRYRWQNGQVV